jgi:hypothetical protein
MVIFNALTTDQNSPFRVIQPDVPRFELVKTIPQGFASQIQDAVRKFMEDSNMPQGVNKDGFYNQTLKTMAQATVLGQGGDLWLGIRGNELYTYILAYIGQSVDDRLSYVVNQAWVRKDQRGKPWVRDAWQKVRQRAKDTFCAHLLVLSSKENDAVYCRFLGKGFHRHGSILKETL